METLEAINTRRSIRKYKNEAIDQKQIDLLLEAAMNAPSAIDQQPWQFLVVTEPELLKKIPEHHSHSDLVAQAPAAILVCSDADLDKLPGFWMQDCSTASQNILLAAHALDLGAVWIGVYPTAENVKGLKTLFELPETITPFALIAIGKPDEELISKQNQKPERIHRNKW